MRTVVTTSARFIHRQSLRLAPYDHHMWSNEQRYRGKIQQYVHQDKTVPSAQFTQRQKHIKLTRNARERQGVQAIPVQRVAHGQHTMTAKKQQQPGSTRII